MTVYICSDSFGCFAQGSDKSWSNLFQDKCFAKNVVNLSRPGASNYLIYLQVKEALSNNCEHVIYQATSSIRNEFSISRSNHTIDYLERYYNSLEKVKKTKTMLCGSWINLLNGHEDILSKKNYNFIKEFYTQYVDLPNLIEKNYIYIKYTLDLLSNAKLKSWAWNRGGFDHTSFQHNKTWDFSSFEKQEANINLWDYHNGSSEPIYHVTDMEVNQNVCDQYLQMLKL